MSRIRRPSTDHSQHAFPGSETSEAPCNWGLHHGGSRENHRRCASYLVLNEPPRIRLANVRFLAGYRRDWLINKSTLDEMRFCSAQLAGMSIADAEQAVLGFPEQLVRPALMHLSWYTRSGMRSRTKWAGFSIR